MSEKNDEVEFIRSDSLDALLHSLPDHWKLDWWIKQLSIFVPTHKLVKREDLQFLFDWIFEDIYDEHDWDKAKRIKEDYRIDAHRE